MFKTVRELLNDEGGATAIEYGLIAALIGVALTVAMTTLETGLSGLFGKIAGKVNPP